MTTHAQYVENIEYHKKHNKLYYQQNSERLRAHVKQWRIQKRKEALKLLGSLCFVCGCNQRKFVFHEKAGKAHSSCTPFLVLQNPERFVLLCEFPCHQMVHFCMKYLRMTWIEIKERLTR